jgi:hypothetical protein
MMQSRLSICVFCSQVAGYVQDMLLHGMNPDTQAMAASLLARLLLSDKVSLKLSLPLARRLIAMAHATDPQAALGVLTALPLSAACISLVFGMHCEVQHNNAPSRCSPP